MRKRIIIGLSLFVLVGIKTSLWAQSDSSNRKIAYFIRYRILYPELDTTLSEDGKILIDTLFQMIIAKHKDTLSFFEKREIVMNSFMTVEERKKNQIVGMQRCLIILDYIERKYHIRRNKFYIRDMNVDARTDSEVEFIFPPPRAKN